MATINNINYRPVSQDEKAEWGGYKHLMEHWEDLGESSAKSWVKEMREHPEFRVFVETPSHKNTFINYKGFALFIKWKTRNRYKAKKETLREMLDDIRNEKALLKEVAELDFEDLIA